MYAIFSIDGVDNAFNQNIFHNFLKMHDLWDEKTGVRVGRYASQSELSYVMSQSVFEEYIRDTVFIAEQESILWVASGNKQEAHLEYLADGRIKPIGSMHSVCREEAEQSDAYTMDPKTGNFWIAKEGNNDGSYRRSCEQYRKG